MSGAGKDPTVLPGSAHGSHPATADPTAGHHAFRVHVQPQIEVLLRVAHTLTGSWADAEDLVQDLLIRAYRNIGGFDDAHPRAWLLTILRHAHLNSLRRQRPELPGDRVDAGHRPAFGAPVAGSAEDAVGDAVMDAVMDDRVEAALAALDPRFRMVLLLIDVEQLTYAEVADLLGVPVSTVMSRLSRARDRVRAQLRTEPTRRSR
jgi:RNA polymerase sigma-70 factor (ECF subfamily)